MTIDPSVLLKQTPLDIGGAMAEGAQANTAILKNQQLQQQVAEKNQYEATIKDYLKIDGTDLYTSEGIKKALPELKGRIAPQHLMELSDRASQLAAHEASYAQGISKLSENALDAHDKNIEHILKMTGPLVEFKGTDEEWKPFLAKKLEEVSGQKRPDGKPLIPPSEIEGIMNIDQAHFKQLYASTKVNKEAIARAKQEAETKKTIAQADALDGLGATEQWQDSAGNRYLKSIKQGTVVKVDNDGALTGVPGDVLPPGSVKLGTKPDSSVAKQKAAAELLDFTKNPATAAEEQMARVYQVTRKMESLGQNSPLRPRIAMLAAQMAVDEGRNVLGDNATYKNEAAAAANLTKQYGVIKAGEQTVLNNLELIKPLINKVDATGVPVLERWIRAGKKEVAGDADVTALNALIVSTQADIGKVLSASTGAAGVPVAALTEAKKYMDGNLTVSQFNALYDIIPKEMTARTAAMESQIAGSINKINRLTQAPGKPGASARPDAVVTPADQKSRDGDAVQLMYQELKKTREQYKSAKPEDKDRLEKDIAGIQREIKKLGGKVEDAEPAGAVPASRQEELNKKYGL